MQQYYSFFGFDLILSHSSAKKNSKILPLYWSRKETKLQCINVPDKDLPAATAQVCQVIINIPYTIPTFPIYWINDKRESMLSILFWPQMSYTMYTVKVDLQWEYAVLFKDRSTGLLY